MLKIFLNTLLILVLNGLGLSQAYGHGVDSLGVTGQLAGNKINLVATPSLAAFVQSDGQNFLDDNSDGKVSAMEVKAHRGDILSRIDQDIRFTNEKGEPAARYFGDVVLVTSKVGTNSSDVKHLKLILRYRWSESPAVIDFRYNLLANSVDDEVPVKVANLLAKTTQTGNLSKSSTFFRILENNERALSDSSVLTDTSVPPMWLAGIKHVAEGVDHLLFILVLVLAAPRFRTLIVPLSAFTLTHSLTLAAVSLGFNPAVPSLFIEVGIAASIVLIAMFELAGIKFRRLYLITGLLGFIHGLGFSQALSESLGGLSVWTASLIELTLGIELAQLAIALIFLGLFKLIDSARNHHKAIVASVACIGMYWTVERLLGSML